MSLKDNKELLCPLQEEQEGLLGLPLARTRLSFAAILLLTSSWHWLGEWVWAAKRDRLPVAYSKCHYSVSVLMGALMCKRYCPELPGWLLRLWADVLPFAGSSSCVKHLSGR